MPPKFDESVKSAAPEKHRVLFDNFEQIAEVMNKHAQQRILWAPSSEPRRLLNNYLDILWSLHVAKFNELCESLIESVNRRQFLLYGLIGRSLIEHAATMRYYFKQRLQPVVEEATRAGVVTAQQIQIIVEELDKYLRGSRFDWNAFLSGNFDQLAEENEESATQRQVNILTCMQKWAKETPSVMVLYDLFCDLVHPNIGSTLLVMQSWQDGAGFGGQHGEKMGQDIMVRTLAGLVGLFNEIQRYLNSMLLLQMPIEGDP